MRTRTGPTQKSHTQTVLEGVHVVAVRSELHAVTVYNGSGVDLYLLVFDAAAEPAVGAVPTLSPVKIPAQSTGGHDWNGLPMRNGIVAALSSTDVTYTPEAGSGWFTVGYA